MRAIWDMLEIFYVDKSAESWFPERLVDWLVAHGPILSKTEASLSRRLIEIKRRLSIRQFPEEESDYWEGIASALAVGWFDFVVTFLRMHGSYRHDQIDKRQTENGLVEAVAVLVSMMPRLRPSLPPGSPGVAYSFKPEFAKEWERWRIQVTKLDRSAFWNECHNQKTLQGLKKLLAILQGNVEVLVKSTYHWMELLTAHYLHVRPFAIATEGLVALANTCKEYKGTHKSDELQELILAVLGDNTEVVIAECVRLFEPWMMAHMVELLTAKDSYVQNLLRKERDVQGGISLEELYRLSYAQSLASDPLTWQVAPVYLASCPGQGLGMLETLLLRLPVSDDSRLAQKALDVCRLYDLQAVGTTICRKVGVHSWKHGRIGAGIVWLQRARDKRLLSALSDQLLASVSTGSTWGHVQDFEQIQGLVDLLGTDFQATGGLSILHRQDLFHTFTSSWLFKVGITPKRFWMSILQDSVELLEWPEQVLLNAQETNTLLNCVQELKLAKLWGDVDSVDEPGSNVDRVRLALATNLGRSFLQMAIDSFPSSRGLFLQVGSTLRCYVGLVYKRTALQSPKFASEPSAANQEDIHLASLNRRRFMTESASADIWSSTNVSS
ncbi:hypothetical protein AXG93_3822s1310 [Marchantia polymorpha subsp. ruderalis]|uniref:Nuclear pore complex protein Nup85 n=1 Tax=Marchantia polymorpha subsp. ruderalis TaxID=1480154 RepID=A0A176WKT0_MARPO|nr:hypothetical protein AXG93_3822s1310 [Marchantia polymorpha subsp. ruderalis]